jgi:hypothetical protein
MSVMAKDDAAGPGRPIIANDNGPVLDPAAVEAALDRIAEAIGRHIAREHIRARRAANDNKSENDGAR